MTVISAIISKKCIAVASDSLLTVYNKHQKTFEEIETQKPKIVKVERLKAILSYWGFVAKSRYSQWTTYDFLCRMVKNNINCNSIQDFANYIKENLINEIGSELRTNGIGIHLIGYSKKLTPEFYLISNYADTQYNKFRELSVSSELYGTLIKHHSELSESTTEDKKAETINDFLNKGHMFVYNNGDPAMFNFMYCGYYQTYQVAKKRIPITANEIEVCRFLAREPIQTVANIQRCLYDNEHRLVGGRIHDLVLEKNGMKYSSSSKSAKII
jgi:hypothetical protein